MADDRNISSELSRELTLFHITMMGLGMMIGAGVFVGMGPTIGRSGPGGVLLTFGLNGLVALFTACSYAELSSAFPRTGGAYHYARYGFGRGVSFVSGWMEWFASSVAGSLYAVTFAVYTVRFFIAIGWMNWVPDAVLNYELWGIRNFILVKLVAILVAAAFIFVNYRGASETGQLGALMTLGQTVFLWIIGGIGVWVVLRHPERLKNFEPFLPSGWGVVLATMGATYVAFEGYEVIAQAADETIEPKKNLPKAMLYSVLIVTLTYVLVAFACVAAIPGDGSVTGGLSPYEWIAQFGETGFGESVALLLPSKNLANFLLTLAVIFASTSALNATVFSATRALYALGRDRMLPGVISRIHPKRKTPWVALLGTSALIIAIALLKTKEIAICASMMFLGLFFLVNLCVIRVRQNMGDELSYGFLMPGYPVVPIAAIVLQGLLVFWIFQSEMGGGHGPDKTNPLFLFIVPAWVIVGIALYFAYARHHVRASSREVQVLEEDFYAAPTANGNGHGYRVMVSVANPKNAVELVGTTYKLCAAKNAAEVELLHMVPVPEQVPLSDAEEYMWEGKEAIAEIMLYLEPLFPITSTLRYCRNLARGIVGAVREKRANLLIMGWHGEQRSYGFSLGSTVDPVIERSPCNVVIAKGKCNGKLKKILVPLAGGPNSAFSLEVAAALADKEEGAVTAFSVINPGRKSKFDVVSFIAQRQTELGLPEERITVKAVNASNVVDAILQEAEEYDAVIVGCTRRPLIYRMTRESIPEEIARRCEKPLIMVNAATGIQSWIKRWF